MISNKWFRNGVSLCAGIVGAFGIGPVIMTARSDLMPEMTPSIAVTTIFIVIVGVIVTLLFLLWCRRLASDSREGRSPGIILKTFGVALLLSSLGWILVSVIDAPNTSAWRHTRILVPEPGFNARTIVEERLHYLRLTASRDYKGGGDIGAFQVSWPVWLSGGTVELLLRYRQSREEIEGRSCSDRSKVTISAIRNELAIHSAILSSLDICNRWRRIEFSLPRQASEIQFNLSGQLDASQSDRSLDISVLSVRPDYHFLWVISKIIASGFLLALAYLWLSGARESARSETGQVIAGRSSRSESGVATAAAILLFLILSNVFVFWFVSQEKTIYTWDTAGYWTSSRHVSEILRGESPTANVDSGVHTVNSSDRLSSDRSDWPTLSRDPLTSLVRNVRYSEYNVTNNLPVAAVMALIGGSRMVYELSLTNLYALAAVLVLLLVLRGLAKESLSPWIKWWPVIPVLVVLCYVPFWVPLIRGYIGVCVVAVNLAVLGLYFSLSKNNTSLPILTCIGLLLVAGVLLQRWNAYWVVAFLFVTFIDGIRQLLTTRRFHVDYFIRCFQVPIVTGSVAFVTLAVIAWPLMVTMATTDYADIYSAYAEHTSLLTALGQLVRSFGLVLLLLMVCSAAYLVSKRSTRRLAALLSIQMIVMFVHFSGTQTMGPHHLYVLMPGSFLILSNAAVEVLSDRRRLVTMGGIVMLMLYIANGIGSGVAVFSPSGDTLRANLVPLIPDNRRVPLVRDDLDVFADITAYIDGLLARDSKIRSIYVLSSSQTLNVAHLRNVAASTGIEFRSVDRLLHGSEVDKRDGFPRQLLRADLVIVAEPIQYNRRPSDQYVVGIPAQAMLDGTDIGQAFRKLPVSFQFGGGGRALIYQRERDISTKEIAGLSDKLRAIYPNRPNIYK